MPQGDLQPRVTLTRSGRAIVASWPPIEPAYGYHVVVTDPAGNVVDTADIAAAAYQPPVMLAGAGIVAGGSYSVVVSVAGLPSQPASITLPTPAAILTGLHDRLIAARTHPASAATDWSYPLDDMVLPDAGDGDPGEVRTALTAALAPSASTPLTIIAPADPVLDPAQGTLALTGTSDALTADPATAVTVTFTVTDDLKLAATWIAAPPDGWTLASAFAVLAETPFDYLPVSGVSLVATTFGHSDPGFFFPQLPGLAYQATLAVRGDLAVTTGQPNQAGTSYTRIGGPAQVTADGTPQFSWTAESALGPLTIPRVGQNPLTLSNGLPQLSCAPARGGNGQAGQAQPSPPPPPAGIDPTAGQPALAATVNTLVITGQVTLAGGPV